MAEADESVNCPNCAELIQPKAIVCRFCDSGLSTERFRQCPSCAEMIWNDAAICRYCQSPVNAGKQEESGEVSIFASGVIDSINNQIMKHVGELARIEKKMANDNVDKADSEIKTTWYDSVDKTFKKVLNDGTYEDLQTIAILDIRAAFPNAGEKSGLQSDLPDAELKFSLAKKVDRLSRYLIWLTWQIAKFPKRYIRLKK